MVGWQWVGRGGMMAFTEEKLWGCEEELEVK